MSREQVKEIFERVLDWPDDDQEKLARFVRELELWRADDEGISDERRDVAKAV